MRTCDCGTLNSEIHGSQNLNREPEIVFRPEDLQSQCSNLSVFGILWCLSVGPTLRAAPTKTPLLRRDCREVFTSCGVQSIAYFRAYARFRCRSRTSKIGLTACTFRRTFKEAVQVTSMLCFLLSAPARQISCAEPIFRCMEAQ